MNQLIIEDFLELVTMNVHSKDEREIGDFLKTQLQELGLEVDEDHTGDIIGGNTGNLIAVLKGDPKVPSVLFSAHMDRVKNNGRIHPQIDYEKGLISSDGSTILAADDVAGVCAILDGLRQIKALNIPHGDIEVVFSVCEEMGVLGAKYLDYRRIKSKIAYVFDAPGRFGRIVNCGPSKCKLKLTVKGRSAHAGNEPEKGINAIKVAAVALSKIEEGRINMYTTANYGSFHGGDSTNIVCDYVEILGEVRSTKEGEIEAYLKSVKPILTAVASEYQAEIEIESEILYPAFSVAQSEGISSMAISAMKGMGVEPQFSTSGGGMDGNHFNFNGIQTLGVATGYFKNHTNDEFIHITDLIKSGTFLVELVKEVNRFKMS